MVRYDARHAPSREALAPPPPLSRNAPASVEHRSARASSTGLRPGGRSGGRLVAPWARLGREHLGLGVGRDLERRGIGTTEVRRSGACRTPELELASYPLLQVHLAEEPSDRREHDGVELPQLRSRLDGEQVLEPRPRLLEPFECRLEFGSVLGA